MRQRPTEVRSLFATSTTHIEISKNAKLKIELPMEQQVKDKFYLEHLVGLPEGRAPSA